MKVRLPFKIALAIVTSALTYLLIQPPVAQSTFDLPGLNQQVQHHEEVLQNHEARLNNLENDTKQIQTVTKIQPAPDPQPVPAVTTPEPEPQPQPEPVPGANTHHSCVPGPCPTPQLPE